MFSPSKVVGLPIFLVWFFYLVCSCQPKMPRKSKVPAPGTRKYGTKSNYTPEMLQECLQKVGSGEKSAYIASKEYKIPINTIKNKIKNKHSENVGRPTALGQEEENIIKDHVKALADTGCPIGIDDVTLIIQRYLNSTKRKVKVFTNNRPGWEWGQLFLNRHQDLKLTIGHNISRSRAQVNEEKINQFFENLETELQDVPPENIFNVDETGFHDDPKKKKLLFRRKCRNPEVIRNSTKSCYTAVFCGNAAGEFIPPYFIFKAKNTWTDWIIGAPPGSRMIVTKSGWIDLESFDNWFATQFLPIASKKPGKKVLICDNLSSHISVNTLKLCKDYDIKFVCLVPNSTHLLQPLDVGYFSALKANWRTVLLNWRETSRGKKAIALPKNCFTTLVKRTLELGAEQSSANIVAGFKATGIYPVNRQEAINRLADYARTEISAESARQALGESFKSYLEELREKDLGIKSRRKFQMPVVAGKSVSVEEVELYYQHRAENKNKKAKKPTETNNGEGNSKNTTETIKPVKRGRPQGAKNKKKSKKEQDIPIVIPEVEEDHVPFNNEVVIEEFDVIDGVLQPAPSPICSIYEETASKPELSLSNYDAISPGTTVIFRDEGSLFPGKVISTSPPCHIITVMNKAIDGGWKWPNKREVLKINFNNIVSIVDASKIKIKNVGVYNIEDDLLYNEWGE